MSDELIARVTGVIAKTQHIPLETITIDSTFEELKIDSLDGINLLFALEGEFDVDIPDDEARKIRMAALTLVCLLGAPASSGKVILRWTQPSIPAAKAMGFAEIVVPWDSESLIRTAIRQGYRVYVEIPAGNDAFGVPGRD
jgi:acyl carrier protein